MASANLVRATAPGMDPREAATREYSARGLLRSQPLVAFLLAIFTVVVLTATARDIGLTWDEPIYIEASQSYIGWFADLARRPADALSSQGVVEYWGLNHEHPPADKIWSGLVWAGARYIFDDPTAHRLGNILLAGGLVGLVYLVVAGEYGQVAGAAAAAALLAMPRFFFHAHLATLDLPSGVAIFAVCFVFWRTVKQRGMSWALWLGVVAGLAAATKITAAVELPAVLGLWTIAFARRRYVFVRLAVASLVAFLVAIALWPWLYHDTWDRLRAYVAFMTVDHYKIAQWYLGRMYLPLPWHYPFVTTLAVVPLTTTVLAALGTGCVLVGSRRQAVGWLFILGTLVPLLTAVTGRGEVFDDERLLMSCFGFMAALAGVGFAAVVRTVRAATQRFGWRGWSLPLVALFAVLSVAPQIVSAAAVYPHLLSYYSENVGGLRGASRLGFETTYWAEPYADALDYLNGHAPPGAMVWVEAHDVMLYYQSIGKLRRDLRIASPHGDEGIVPGTRGYKASIDQADEVVIEYRQSGFGGAVTRWLQGRQPVYREGFGRIPLLEIYER